jgi:hypothetical protein
MPNFFKKNMQWSLITLAIILLAFIVGYLLWGMSVIVHSANVALDADEQNGKGMNGFNLDAAKKLDLRGLVQ